MMSLLEPEVIKLDLALVQGSPDAEIMYMAEDAGAADLIAGGRLQLGISRGRQQAIDGGDVSALLLARGDQRRRHGAAPHRGLPRGAARRGFCAREPEPDVSEPAGPAAPRAVFGGPARTDLVGRRHQRHRGVGGQLGMNLQTRHSRSTRADARFTSSRRSRSAFFARHGRRPGTRASRGCRSAAASSRWWTTGTAAISGAATRARTRSASSAATSAPFSGGATPPSRTSRRAAQDGRSHRRGRHAAADRAEPARRRLQRPRHRGDPKYVAPGLGWR